MLPEFVDKVTLYTLLHRIDQDLAEQVRARGCPHCGGPLHRATWQRKPRGGPDAADKYATRLGLCCGDCRRRQLPPSTLFFGRRVYWGVAVVVVMGLRQATPRWSLRRLRRLLGVSRQTTKRWAEWFATVFPRGPRWTVLRARLAQPLDETRLPTALVECYGRRLEPMSAVVACLRFLAVGVRPDEHAG